MFDPEPIIKQLEANVGLFDALLSHLDDDEVRWKPTAEKWSIMEVLCHLIYEEEYDFLARLKYALENFRGELPMIDSEGSVTESDLSKADLRRMLRHFKEKRSSSITFLQHTSSQKTNWENSLIHPQFGEMSAQLLLANWLAHDYLHTRQILSLKHQYLVHFSRQNLEYAGNW